MREIALLTVAQKVEGKPESPYSVFTATISQRRILLVNEGHEAGFTFFSVLLVSSIGTVAWLKPSLASMLRETCSTIVLD